jgi:hypothetical protein
MLFSSPRASRCAPQSRGGLHGVSGAGPCPILPAGLDARTIGRQLASTNPVQQVRALGGELVELDLGSDSYSVLVGTISLQSIRQTA